MLRKETVGRPRRVVQKGRHGVAVVELAVILPLLVFLALIATDYARVFHFSQIVSDCARNGAMYASNVETAKDSPYVSAEEAAKANAPAWMRDKLTVTVKTQSRSFSSGNLNTVTVTVSYPFTTVTNFPWIPRQTTISKSVEMVEVPAVPDA